jgi:hypothetical protein
MRYRIAKVPTGTFAGKLQPRILKRFPQRRLQFPTGGKKHIPAWRYDHRLTGPGLTRPAFRVFPDIQ